MTKKVVGVLLLIPGVIAFGVGLTYLLGTVNSVISGHHKSTGYGLGGYLFLSGIFFVPPLLIGMALIFSGIQLFKARN